MLSVYDNDKPVYYYKNYWDIYLGIKKEWIGFNKNNKMNLKELSQKEYDVLYSKLL